MKLTALLSSELVNSQLEVDAALVSAVSALILVLTLVVVVLVEVVVGVVLVLQNDVDARRRLNCRAVDSQAVFVEGEESKNKNEFRTRL